LPIFHRDLWAFIKRKPKRKWWNSKLKIKLLQT